MRIPTRYKMWSLALVGAFSCSLSALLPAEPVQSSPVLPAQVEPSRPFGGKFSAPPPEPRKRELPPGTHAGINSLTRVAPKSQPQPLPQAKHADLPVPEFSQRELEMLTEAQKVNLARLRATVTEEVNAAQRQLQQCRIALARAKDPAHFVVSPAKEVQRKATTWTRSGPNTTSKTYKIPEVIDAEAQIIAIAEANRQLTAATLAYNAKLQRYRSLEPKY